MPKGKQIEAMTWMFIDSVTEFVIVIGIDSQDFSLNLICLKKWYPRLYLDTIVYAHHTCLGCSVEFPAVSVLWLKCPLKPPTSSSLNSNGIESYNKLFFFLEHFHWQIHKIHGNNRLSNLNWTTNEIFIGRKLI